MKKIVKNGVLVITASLIVSGVAGWETPAQAAQKVFNASSFALTEVAASGAYVEGAVLKGFSDVPKTHWAYSAIENAAKAGYVGGYKDGTFKPAAQVTVAEFTQMVMKATNTKMGSDHSKWYNPAIDGARAAGYMTANDFKDKNYNKKMTRAEMSKMAVLAVGGKANSSNEFMLRAVQLGLITGNGSKGLDMKGTTDRAQSVVIIQRLMSIKDGRELKVDEKALAEAMDLVGAKKDAWGQAMRTTNLPSNFKDYPYILRDLPNEFYELSYGGKVDRTPAQRMTADAITVKTYGKLKDRVEDWFDHIFNVDYRTIDYKWVDELYAHFDYGQFTTTSKNNFYTSMKGWVDWVKENKIVTEGEAWAEISSIATVDGFPRIKVAYSYKVVSANSSVFKNKDIDRLFAGTIKNQGTVKSSYKLGTEISVASVVAITSPKSEGWGAFDKMGVDAGVDLAKSFVLLK